MENEKLNEAWKRIDALRPTRSRNEYEVGYSQAVEQALLIIEELGGRDPQTT